MFSSVALVTTRRSDLSEPTEGTFAPYSIVERGSKQMVQQVNFLTWPFFGLKKPELK